MPGRVNKQHSILTLIGAST